MRTQQPSTLFLMVGLPGAGKTVRAKELAAEHQALLLTPDAWMVSLFGQTQPDGKRDLLEGLLVSLALDALRLNVDVVLDFGLWGRDERSALRSLAGSAGAECEVVYLSVDRALQLHRIQERQVRAPHETFPMTEVELDAWREQFEVPDDAELAGADLPSPPVGYESWFEWAAGRWPSLGRGVPDATS
jgi:predicted kinase